MIINNKWCEVRPSVYKLSRPCFTYWGRMMQTGGKGVSHLDTLTQQRDVSRGIDPATNPAQLTLRYKLLVFGVKCVSDAFVHDKSSPGRLRVFLSQLVTC